MGKIGTYVDERFNGTNAKIKVINAELTKKIDSAQATVLIDDRIQSFTGGESAADVLAMLKDHTDTEKNPNPHGIDAAILGLANFENKSIKDIGDALTGNIAENNTGFVTGGAVHTAVEAIKATAEAARTEDEVNSQIDAKITALNLGQYTTEAEVKSIVDGVIAGAADSETYNSLTKLVDYIDAHGGEASEMAQAIETLEGDVKGLKEAPSAGIEAYDIEAWNDEIGAKDLAKNYADNIRNEMNEMNTRVWALEAYHPTLNSIKIGDQELSQSNLETLLALIDLITIE
jgi:hypothetical protein